VKTISTHEAKTQLSRGLAAVEADAAFGIAPGRRPIALLSRWTPARRGGSRVSVEPGLDRCRRPALIVADSTL